MVQQEDARVACQPFFYLDRAGASPGESTFNLIPWSSGNDSWLTTRKRWFESIRDYWDCWFSILDFRMHLSGRAQIKSQIGNQQSQITRLGRQLADHLGLEPWMLWVRIPLELFINTSSRSSPECSPPCQGGDQGFKSPRGRFLTTLNDAVRNLEKRRSSNLRDFVGSTPTRVNGFICVG
jgi:hypothetical protein